MKTQGTSHIGTTAATVVLTLALGSSARCALGFVVSGPPRACSSAAAVSRGTSWGGAVASLPQQQRATSGALSMVSATFGEKINTDTIVLDKTSTEAIAELYPEALANNPGFLEQIGHGDTRTYTEEQLRKKLQVAQVFVKMANLVILSRGMNILAEDFKFFSPGTGTLDRDSWLRLTKTLDVAFSSFKILPTAFTAYKDGVISFRRTYRTVHDGYLRVGEKTYPPTFTKVVSDVDLCTVSFDDVGLVRSYTFGLMVELVEAVEDLDAVAGVENINARVESQKAKMLSLEGQESSIAYSKCKADIYTMGLDKEALMEKINSAPNTMGLGGIRGLFAAVGADFPKNDLTSLEGTDACGDIAGGRLAGFSFPSEVREYDAFDTDSFTEMK